MKKLITWEGIMKAFIKDKFDKLSKEIEDSEELVEEYFEEKDKKDE